MTPVFPPMDASTCARRVVGILINFNPLFVRFEIKADKYHHFKVDNRYIVCSVLVSNLALLFGLGFGLG